MKNVTDTLLSQYANSPTILSLIDSFNENIDPSVNLDDFYRYVWNVDTAQGFGLDIWGKIVNISRKLELSFEGKYLGFNEALYTEPNASDPRPFGSGIFYTGVQSGNYVFTLSDTAYRRLIMVKAMANITDCTAPNLNKLLRFLFEGRGRCYVEDLGNMEMRYVFEFPLTIIEYSIMVNTNVVPRPSGVTTYILRPSSQD
ncbi:DUF2612 domain-containing protein [Citrobacter sp. S2-9]|uniref:DUF2612 domain-containing protein n=1 Tax=Citrobacter enshiensis TaxID=2971264 RepID=A0ABT8PRD3_9ENTR|nr:DUF2612 domain-containing protein [Citrobacter enshiensis]MDN8598608.1 DUF2612 domain-containing protein [Citrobacter enshiensis]